MNTSITLSLIKDELSKTTHKRSREKFIRINNAVIELITSIKLKPFTPHHPLNSFPLPDKEFNILFGENNKQYVETHILKKLSTGYFINVNKYAYNTYEFRIEILEDIFSQLGVKQYSKQILKRKYHKDMHNDTPEFEEEQPMYRPDCLNNLAPFSMKEYIAKEDSYGRIHCAEQHIPKLRKIKIYAGAYDYDIEASSPTILSQMYTKLTGNSTPIIDEYISQKTEIRKKLAEYIDTDIFTIKKFITSIFYGGKMPTDNQLKSVWASQFSIVKTLGIFKTKQLLKHNWVKSLICEVKEVTNALYEDVRKNNKDKKITNAAGFTITLPRWSKQTVIYHLYIGVERQILNIILDIFNKYNLGILPIHDGFLSNKKLKLDVVQNIIFKETGYKVSYSVTQF